MLRSYFLHFSIHPRHGWLHLSSMSRMMKMVADEEGRYSSGYGEDDDDDDDDGATKDGANVILWSTLDRLSIFFIGSAR